MAKRRFALINKDLTTSGYLQNIVEDTTPQLGGALDVNGQSINFDDDENLNFGTGTDWQIDYNSGSSALLLQDALNNSTLAVTEGASWRFSINNSTGVVQVHDGYSLRIANSADTDYLNLSHNGTDMLYAHTNTNIAVFSGAAAYTFDDDLRVLNGERFRIYDSTNTDYIEMYHDGTNAIHDYISTNTALHYGPTNGWAFSPDDVNGVNVSLGLNIVDHSVVLSSSTDGDMLAFTLYNADGTTNPRVGFYLDDTAGTYGIAQTWSSGGQMTFKLYQGGTEYLSLLGGTSFDITEHTYVKQGHTFRVYDSTNADYLAIQHDGTDANISFSGTTDLNIDSASGLTGQIKCFADVHLVSGTTLQIRDSGNTDWGDFAHDGTNLTLDATNTTNFKFTGITALDIDGGTGDAGIYLKADTSNTIEGSNPFIEFQQDGALVKTTIGHTGFSDVDALGNTFTGTASANSFCLHNQFSTGDFSWGIGNVVHMTLEDTLLTVKSGANAASRILIGNETAYGDSSDGQLHIIGENASTIYGVQLAVVSSNFQLQGVTTYAGSAVTTFQNFLNTHLLGGADLRIYDSTNTDNARHYHNGTDYYTDLSNSTWWRIRDVTSNNTGILMQDGMELRIYDTTDVDYISLKESGTAAAITTNNNRIQLSAASGGSVVDIIDGTDLQIRDAGYMRTYDSTDTDYVEVKHDGTEGIITVVGGELNINSVIDTQDQTATGNTSGATVIDHGSSMRDIGFNVLPAFNFNTADTLEARHCGAATGKTNNTAITITGPTSSDVDFPVGGVTTVMNINGNGNITLSDTATCTMYYLDASGVTDIAGSGTLAPGGVVTLYRYSTTAIYIFGNGFTP